MKKLGLLPRLVLGIIVGILLGKLGIPVVVRILATFNSIFGNFLGFTIPLIIIGFIIPGIADLGKSAGKLLAITTLIAYCSTVIGGCLAFFTNHALLHNFISPGMAAELANPEKGLLKPYFTIDMPPLMGVMSALLIAFILGIGIAVCQDEIMKKISHEFQGIVEKVIANIIIPLLPLHICGIFCNMTNAGQVAAVLSVFAKVFVVIIILHIVILVFQYSVAGSVAGANPFKLLKGMIPAYMTAIGTQSSAATIPVTLACTKRNGVVAGIADFVIPLCATIHLTGSTITLTSCTMAVMLLNGRPIEFSNMFGFILMLGITMVAAPGVPGGAVMAALGILQSMMGFNADQQALMIALYLAQDSFGTACNVTGDGAIAVLVNKIGGHKLKPMTDEEIAKLENPNA
ncbi:MAG: dicarboxylate/amino acid:cation symporter [Acidaminococcus sp.]|jgi:Na+/H+-dicarboxylate symporter|nr:dicarboxylate/amino acid:cation symporter [Acidaminococcus sp.]MCI2099600.1 dicarboxylate/amino acid:cation symporter [Acidaminococcus sp.]MCI2113685.1 dicarboxylate/amino acid:cation symporter [Acidaminococcus sp.]MCI2115768.1 dicarboxylate/amino acid:cation symporter [Acidaminococcus sp.]